MNEFNKDDFNKDEILKKIQEEAQAFEEALKNGEAGDLFGKILGGNNGAGLGDLLGEFVKGAQSGNTLTNLLDGFKNGENPFGGIMGEFASAFGSTDCPKGECDSDCAEGECKAKFNTENPFSKILGDFLGKGTEIHGMPPFGNPLSHVFGGTTKGFGAVNVLDLGDKYLVTAGLPGVTKSAIKVSCLDDTLIIEVNTTEGKTTIKDDVKVILNEYNASNINRQINLPNIDSDNIKVKFTNGELTIEANKLEIKPIFYDVK